MSQEPPMRPAYYKGRWVLVPMFHVPKEAANEDGSLSRFRFTPLDGSKIDPIPTRSLEPSKIPNAPTECIIPWRLSDKEVKTLCKQNDLVLGWVTNRFNRKQTVAGGTLNRRLKRKNRPLTSVEFRRLLKELYKLDKQTGLIADILWFFNKRLKDSGSYVSLEELLRLGVEDVAPENSLQGNWIRLQRDRLLIHDLPPYLWKALCKQLHKKAIFVFSNRNGGALLPVHMERYLQKAAKMAGFTEAITSLSLRPAFNKERVEQWAKKNRIEPSIQDHLEPLTPKEWKALCRAIPSITQRKGRKSSLSP